LSDQFNTANCVIVVRTVQDFFGTDLYELRERDWLLERNLFLVDGIYLSVQETWGGEG